MLVKNWKVFFKNIIDKNITNKTVLVSIIGSFGVKGLALIISFLSMPAYISFFDNDDILGVWFTILALLSWLLSFDLGIGNGLRNKLVYCFTKNRTSEAKQFISSAYILYLGITIAMLFIGVLIINVIDLNVCFNIKKSLISSNSLKSTVIIIYISIVLQLFLKLITSIMYSLQKAVIPNVLALITSLSQFLFVLFYKTSRGMEYKLTIVAIVYLISVNLPLIIATAYVFKKILAGYFPKLRYFSKNSLKDVLLLGGTFFWVQIVFMLVTASNEIIISILYGPQNVVQYSIYNKLYTLVPLIIQVMMTPVWSAITKAEAEKDFNWLNRSFNLFTKLILVSVALNSVIYILFDSIVGIWIGKGIYMENNVYSIVYLIYGVVFIAHIIYSTFACGFNDLKLQFIVYTIGALVKIPLIIIFSKIHDSWIIVIFINILIMTIYVVLERFKLKKHIGLLINQDTSSF